MRIASFNINGIKARLPRLLEWLEETRPAVACLQEIKTQDEGFPAAEFEKIGYHAVWHGQKSFNGVAVLADQPRYALFFTATRDCDGRTDRRLGWRDPAVGPWGAPEGEAARL